MHDVATGWTSQRWIEVFHTQSAMFRRAVGDADLAADVPTCPGWTFRELCLHVATFLRSVTGYLTTSSLVRMPPPGPPPDPDPLVWLDEELDNAGRVLAASPPNHPVWTFSPAAPNLSWVWHRRIAHELNLRRWDAEAALRTLSETDREQAVDAIDELLGTLLAAPLLDGMPAEVTGTAVVDCTDGPEVWHVRFAPTEAPYVRLAAEGEVADATLRGRAANLLYQFWGRVDLAGQGDERVLRALRMG